MWIVEVLEFWIVTACQCGSVECGLWNCSVAGWSIAVWIVELKCGRVEYSSVVGWSIAVWQAGGLGGL